MREALHDVTLTLMGTVALVVLVIFLFLRRFVATVIPTLSLPISLMGAVALLWGLNYSLDNISLLGLTLAEVLVVDDAIVMLENIMRHVETASRRSRPPARFARSGLHDHQHQHIAGRCSSRSSSCRASSGCCSTNLRSSSGWPSWSRRLSR